jgi:hypothetical protein
MAKATAKPAGPKPGDVYLMPLEDGRLGACRVLRARGGREPAVLVAATPWVGTAPPDLSEPALREVLVLTHHSWRDEPEMSWVDDPVPADFVRLGELPPTRAEAKRECMSFAGWVSFPQQVLLQWRWDHARAAVDAEDAAEARAEEAQRTAYRPLPPATLEGARNAKHFAGWEGYVESPQLRAGRKAVRDLIDALIALGPDAGEPAKLDVFRRCVKRFNDLDEDEQFIDTIEREDIGDVLDELAGLVGLDDYGESLIGDRDW